MYNFILGITVGAVVSLLGDNDKHQIKQDIKKLYKRYRKKCQYAVDAFKIDN
jgi:hypothetical protein